MNPVCVLNRTITYSTGKGVSVTPLVFAEFEDAAEWVSKYIITGKPCEVTWLNDGNVMVKYANGSSDHITISKCKVR